MKTTKTYPKKTFKSIALVFIILGYGAQYIFGYSDWFILTQLGGVLLYLNSI